MQRDRQTQALVTPQPFEEKTATINGVAVTAQPEIDSGDTLNFSVELNSHSGDLSSYDAAKSVLLKSDAKEYAAASTENTAGEGPFAHHRKLTIVFLRPPSDSFTLVLKNLNDAEGKLMWP